MPLTDFFIGIIGNLLSRHIDPAGKGIAESIRTRLISGQGLPPNHDVERVCRLALKQSLALMAEAMDLHIERPRTLKDAIKNRRDPAGHWKPMSDWWHTDEAAWFTAFTKAAESDELLQTFDLRWVDGASSLSDPLRTTEHPVLQARFGEALLAWAARHIQTGRPPHFFQRWAREGWPLHPDSPAITLHLYKVWCLFLQDHFKENEKVRAILTADWLGSIDQRLSSNLLTAEDLVTTLQEPLGEMKTLLSDLRDSVQENASRFTGLEEQSGRLLALALEYRSELTAASTSLHAVLSANFTLVGSKLDASLSNDALILCKIEEILARSVPVPAPPPASRSGTQRIATSLLLRSDGAAR